MTKEHKSGKILSTEYGSCNFTAAEREMVVSPTDNLIRIMPTEGKSVCLNWTVGVLPTVFFVDGVHTVNRAVRMAFSEVLFRIHYRSYI